MALQSKLFSGDQKLEAAGQSNPAHIVQGAVGDHVGKIQWALILLDGDAIDEAELAAQRYGKSTAAAVLAFKKKRDIINRSYQQQADDIVGIMTMAELDREMRAIEQSSTMRGEGCRAAATSDDPEAARAAAGLADSKA